MSDRGQPALTPRQARLAERVDAVRRAFALETAARVDGPATLEALWRPGEHLGWALTAADAACGWLGVPSRSWESLAVAADAAWWMSPRAAGRQTALVAFDASGAEVARCEGWWRLRPQAQIGGFDLRMRPTISPLRRWWLRGVQSESACVSVSYGRAGSGGSPVGFGRLRIRWKAQPDAPELVCLFVTYTFVVRALRMPSVIIADSAQ